MQAEKQSDAVTKSFARSALDALLIPALSILTAVVLGGIIIALVGGNPFAAYFGLLQGSFGSAKALSETAVWATPYIFAGLGVALHERRQALAREGRDLRLGEGLGRDRHDVVVVQRQLADQRPRPRHLEDVIPTEAVGMIELHGSVADEIEGRRGRSLAEDDLPRPVQHGRPGGAEVPQHVGRDVADQAAGTGRTVLAGNSSHALGSSEC